jgi:Methyltransferase domain
LVCVTARISTGGALQEELTDYWCAFRLAAVHRSGLDGNNFCEIFSNRLPVETGSRLVMPTSWTGHVPFAFWLVSTLRPRLIVELGVHTGTSYCAFCEEVKRAKLGTTCFGIDTWQGDEHSGFYGEEVLRDLREFHDPRYDSFSTLTQTTFDEAVTYFADGSIDLLHLDGLHTDEANEIAIHSPIRNMVLTTPYPQKRLEVGDCLAQALFQQHLRSVNRPFNCGGESSSLLSASKVDPRAGALAGRSWRVCRPASEAA